MTTALRKADLYLDAAPITLLPAWRAVETAAPKPAPLPAPTIHPIALCIPVAATAWFVVVAWCAFGGGETSLVLAVITLFFLIFLGLFVGGAAMGRDVTPERARNRTFQEFLAGDVDIGSGRITGREALWQIAVMPVGLVCGFTIIAMIAVSL